MAWRDLDIHIICNKPGPLARAAQLFIQDRLLVGFRPVCSSCSIDSIAVAQNSKGNPLGVVGSVMQKSLLVFAFFASFAVNGLCQTTESGEYRLYKLQQPIGVEKFTIAPDGPNQLLTSHFEFNDRTTKVPLDAKLLLTRSLTPISFELKGKTSRWSDVDLAVEISGSVAGIKGNGPARKKRLSDRFFTIEGYAPVSVQMLLIRYWLERGKGQPLPLLPEGTVTITPRGEDDTSIGGTSVRLSRYEISGLIWGSELVWLTPDRRIAALVCRDAELDRFEAVAPEFSQELSRFIRLAAEQNMSSLAMTAKKIRQPGESTIAIRGVTLIDGTGRSPVPDSTVVIERGIITAAGPRSTTSIPKNARVVDGAGKSLLPGLWDMHAHFSQIEWGPIYLAAGITTVRDCGDEVPFITAVRDSIRSGRGLGPQLLLAAEVDSDNPGAIGIERINSASEVSPQVSRFKALGFDQIKLYNFIRPELVSAITSEAHRQGLTVTGHVPRGMKVPDAVLAGMDQINHLDFVYEAVAPPANERLDPNSAAVQNLIKLLIEHKTVIDPTVAVNEMHWHDQAVPASRIEPGVSELSAKLSRQFVSSSVASAEAPQFAAKFNDYLALLGELHRA
jgi:hypothetical protein